jgi:hypothetical protein
MSLPIPILSSTILPARLGSEMTGADPTGTQVTFTGPQTDYILGGKIVESWSNWDTLGMLQQIGAVPAPGRQAGR